MTYGLRSSGTHALTCDKAACASELISHTQDDLVKDANLSGWLGDDKEPGKHTCPDCQCGINAGKSLLRATYGSDTPIITAPMMVKAGDLIVDANGIPYAVYKHDAEEGQPVEVEALDLSELTAPISAQYSEILGYTKTIPDPDELFAGFDVKDVPAGYELDTPGKAPGSPQKPRKSVEGPSLAARVDGPSTGAQKSSKGSAKPSLIETLNEGHKLFDFLDEGSARTGWSSDDE